MALVTTMPTRSKKPIIAERLSVRSVMSRARSAPTIARGRLSTMMKGVRSAPRLPTMTRYTSTTPTAIATEDILETFVDLLEEAATIDGNAGRYIFESGDYPIHLDTDGAGILRHNFAGDSGGAFAFEAEDAERRFPDAYVGYETELHGSGGAFNSEFFQFIDVFNIGAVTSNDDVHRFACDVYLRDLPAHDELIHLQPYGSGGEGILARLCGINADYNLIFAFRHRAAEIYDSVELT